MKLYKLFLTMVLGLLPLSGWCIASWEIVSQKSNITFTATQNNAPIQGEFKKFSGKILFDPKDLINSKINITIDTGSVFASYNEVIDLLKTPDWLNSQLFPTANFNSTRIIQVGSKDYQVQGTLTIRGKTLPISFDFAFAEYSDTSARAEGEVILNRTDFGIGQGEWAKTDEVKDKVTVKFNLSVNKISLNTALKAKQKATNG